MSSSFRTEIKHLDSDIRISHSTNLLFMGSCFSKRIGEKLEQYKFPICINPTGVLYNPASIASSLEIIAAEKIFTSDDLQCSDGKWFSWRHHGSFSAEDPEVCLGKINKQIKKAAAFLREIDFICITFGTAWHYILKNTDVTVANCHKQPDQLFERRLLTSEEIVLLLQKTDEVLRKVNPHIRYIFTVSPVRHIKDGFIGNSLSKSILITAAHTLCAALPAEYFPSYEIMMDDLRDYRFYSEDMVHPNETGVSYIWEYFKNTYLDQETKTVCTDLQPVISGMGHRPADETSDSHRRFQEKILTIIEKLEQKYSFLSFDEERCHFQNC